MVSYSFYKDENWEAGLQMDRLPVWHKAKARLSVHPPVHPPIFLKTFLHPPPSQRWPPLSLSILNTAACHCTGGREQPGRALPICQDRSLTPSRVMKTDHSVSLREKSSGAREEMQLSPCHHDLGNKWSDQVQAGRAAGQEGCALGRDHGSSLATPSLYQRNQEWYL